MGKFQRRRLDNFRARAGLSLRMAIEVRRPELAPRRPRGVQGVQKSIASHVKDGSQAARSARHGGRRPHLRLRQAIRA